VKVEMELEEEETERRCRPPINFPLRMADLFIAWALLVMLLN